MKKILVITPLVIISFCICIYFYVLNAKTYKTAIILPRLMLIIGEWKLEGCKNVGSECSESDQNLSINLNRDWSCSVNYYGDVTNCKWDITDEGVFEFYINDTLHTANLLPKKNDMYLKFMNFPTEGNEMVLHRAIKFPN